MKFAIGDKVIEKKDIRPHTSYPVDIVVGFLDDSILTTAWGDGYGDEIHYYDFNEDIKPGDRNWKSGITRHQESELFTPEEAVLELRRLEAEKSKLEGEFNDLRARVQEKLDSAAALVQEATALIDHTGKDFYDMTEECKELHYALSKGGWSHSTMRCKYGR